MVFKTGMSLAVGAVALVVYLVATSIGSWLRLRHIPGPRVAGWSKIWLVKRQVTGKLVLDLGNVCNQYGMVSSTSLTKAALTILTPRRASCKDRS